MSELMIIGCGGCGINLMKDAIAANGTKLIKEATFLGLDTSDRNGSEGLFDIEHMNSASAPGQKAHGSGKNLALNFEGYAPFISDVFTRNKPSKFCIVVMSAAGGSGSGLGFAALRYLLAKGIIAVAVIVKDHSSLIEKNNSTRIMKAISNQVHARFLGKVIPHVSIVNDNRTRRAINDEVVRKLNYLSLFMTETNEESDLEDTKNLFQYAEVTKLPPAMSEIQFFTEADIEDYRGKPPVSFCSLFDHRDNIRPLFEGSAYRSTGVINYDNNPPNAKMIVLVMDHGDAVDKLDVDLAELDNAQQSAKATFVKQRDEATGEDPTGMEW